MTEPDDSIHISGQMLALPVALGGAGDGGGWDPPRNPDFARAAGKALEAAGVGPEDGPLVMLHPGAKWPPKRWAAENFAEVIDLLQEKGCRVAVIGGPGEEKIIETIRRSCRTSPVYLWPPEPMETIWGLMEKADAFVGNDSGPMHMAAAAGAPVVALFGPLSPRRYAPPGERITVFYSDLECSPCPMYFSKNFCHRGHNYCMDDFPPSEIADAVMRSIQSPALPRRSQGAPSGSAPGPPGPVPSGF